MRLLVVTLMKSTRKKIIILFVLMVPTISCEIFLRAKCPSNQTFHFSKCLNLCRREISLEKVLFRYTRNFLPVLYELTTLSLLGPHDICMFRSLLYTTSRVVLRGRAPWLGTISKCVVRVSYCLALFPLYLEWPQTRDLPPTHTHTHTHTFICHFFHVCKNGAFLWVSMKILWNFVKTWI
jgi:hypothetical protein